MQANYDKCLETILHHEGGYVNHPKDPGGETNLGVTKRVYLEHGGTKDMKELTVEDVAPIYKKGNIIFSKSVNLFFVSSSVTVFVTVSLSATICII